MGKFFDSRDFDGTQMDGVEVDVCGTTKTVQFFSYDHGGPDNQQSGAISFDKARELVAWLQDAIAKAEAA